MAEALKRIEAARFEIQQSEEVATMRLADLRHSAGRRKGK